MAKFFSVIVTVPEIHADALRKAIGQAGAGQIGEYGFCSFSVKGTGRFLPLAGAAPYLGSEGKLESVLEERIETVCQEEKLDAVLQAIREVHPYEEPYVYTFPIQLGAIAD